MTGLLELFNPVMGSVDGLLAGLPAFARLLLWGAAAGLASMVLYRLTSPQQRLRQLVESQKALRGSLRGHGPARKDQLRVVPRALARAAQRLVLSFGPAVLSILPIFLMVGFLDRAYAFKSPLPGEPVAVVCGDGAAIKVEDGQQFGAGWTLAWPEAAAQVRVFDAAGHLILTISADSKPGRASKGDLASFLFGAPAGRLATESLVDVLRIETTPLPIVQPELSVYRQWTIPFLLALTLVSLSLKFTLRIV